MAINNLIFYIHFVSENVLHVYIQKKLAKEYFSKAHFCIRLNTVTVENHHGVDSSRKIFYNS